MSWLVALLLCVAIGTAVGFIQGKVSTKFRIPPFIVPSPRFSSQGVAKGKVAVIGYDALPDSLRAIRDGEMAATVEQSPGKQVRTAIDQLVDFIRNKKPMQSVSIAPVVIDSSNLDKAERIDEAK